MNLGQKERIYQGITTAPLTIINLAFLFLGGLGGETQGGKKWEGHLPFRRLQF